MEITIPPFTNTVKYIGHTNMTWFIFNADKSYCTSSETRFDDAFVAKLTDSRGGTAFQVELVGDQIGQYNEDELSLLHYNSDTNVAFIPDNMYVVGSQRHKQSLHDYLSIYSHLDKADQPDNFEETQQIAIEVLGNEVVAQYFEDNILTQAEQQAMKDLLNL